METCNSMGHAQVRVGRFTATFRVGYGYLIKDTFSAFACGSVAGGTQKKEPVIADLPTILDESARVLFGLYRRTFWMALWTAGAEHTRADL
jgi:hypothetical protein